MIKSLPHCKFSDYQPKSTFKHPSTIKNEFEDIPNYKLTSKAFDARHLDRFLVRVNVSDSVQFNSSQIKASHDLAEATGEKLGGGFEDEPVDDGDLVILSLEEK